MRKLMWFTIGFTIACILGIYLNLGIWLGIVTAAACVSSFLLNNKNGKIIGIVMLGITVGTIWIFGHNAFYLKTVRKYDGQTATVNITITDYSYETDYGVAADGYTVFKGKRYALLVYLTDAQALQPGDELQGDFRFRLTTDDSIQGATYHQGKGVFLLAYGKDEVEIINGALNNFEVKVSEFRREIVRILDSAFPEDTVGFARALLLGDSSLLSYEENTAFKVSGIRHVIAVSGLHVSILFSLVYLLCGKRRILTAIIGLPVLFFFAAVAGFTPSIVRACIMQGLMILALLFKKEYDPPSALSFAVLVMLCVNPITITSVSFQLSVGCLVGIFLFYQRSYYFFLSLFPETKGRSRIGKLLRWFVGSISVTLSAMSVTTPLCAIYFGSISIIGILTNLITLWVISFIFYGIMLTCLLGSFCISGGAFVAGIISVPIRYVQTVAEILSKLRYAAVYTCSFYVVLWLVFSYVLFVFLICSKRKRPILCASCATFGLMFALTASWIEPRLDSYRVSVLDVGQGQAILYQSGGQNYLVDCGGDSDELAADRVSQILLSQGITQLDGLILTHYDKDHAGGVEPLLTRIDVEKLYLPDISDDGGIKGYLQSIKPDAVCVVSQDIDFIVSGTHISLFPTKDSDKGNESSLCVLFQKENCDILITGDRSTSGEEALLEHISLPKLELLIVGHHGSANSTGFALLEATRPKAAAISVSENNSYGHPSEETLFRLELFGCKVYRTDLDGTIIFRG
ncbi:MAG: DNA internalization-related competence protein ComEC/Rec2 [Oscillospiraceae bacterium]|nr:DNA internalization-related competence protein ComEC/Rec2 [Oscillospiraceae bacterium]